MYGLVNYQLSGSIHAGIQFGHGVVEYQQNSLGIKPIEKIYNKWASQDKTFIILNGGTTNEDVNSKWYGTLQQHRDLLGKNNILFSEFREPDLNNTLTSICFLVDERVFNKELYPDFVKEVLSYSRTKPSVKKVIELDERNKENYKHWVKKIGGAKNEFLREHLRTLRLA